MNANKNKQELMELVKQTDVKGLLQLIESTFDGVPFVGPNSLSLYQAEAEDNHEWCDQSRDHKGRWQDIPWEHFRECQFALTFLDEKGIQYYFPALMTYCLNRPDRPHVLEDLFERLDPDSPFRRSIDEFTIDQRKAVCVFYLLAPEEPGEPLTSYTDKDLEEEIAKWLPLVFTEGN